MSELSPEDRYLALHDRFQSAMVGALMFGVYTAVVLSAFHRIASERGFKFLFRPLIFWMVVMYICAAFHLGIRWAGDKQTFVDDGGFMSRSAAWNIVAGIARGGIMLIADGIMVWRCWELYAHSWFVIAFPALLLLGELATLISHLVLKELSRLAIVGGAATALKLRTAHNSLTLATTVIVTLLIVYRIVRMGGLRRYRRIVEIIVESSTLYAVALIIYMPFPLHPVLFDTIPNAVLTPIAGIAATLIISRVSLGQGIGQTVEEKSFGGRSGRRQASTLRFQNTFPGSRDEEASTGIGADSMLDSDMRTSKDETLHMTNATSIDVTKEHS